MWATAILANVGTAARRPRLAIAAAVGLACVARLAFGLAYWVDKPLTHDEREYLELARNLAGGRGLTYDPPDPSAPAEPRYGRAPLYPAFLSLVYRATSQTSVPPRSLAPPPPDAAAPLVAIKVLQAGLGALTVWLIALLAWRVAGPGPAAVAAVLSAFYPPLVWTPAYVFSETLFSAFALAAALVLGGVTDRPRRSRSRGVFARAAAAGLLSGLAILTRPVMLFFILLAVAWFARRRQLRAAGAFLLGCAVLVGPWTARNWRDTGRFVLVASEGGITFWTGNNPLARGEGDLAANPTIKEASLEIRRRHPGLDSDALEPIYYREAFRYIAAHPFEWAWLVARKFFYLWVPIGPSYTLHSARYFWASIASYGLLLPAALAGVVALGRPTPVSLALLAGSTVAASLVFFPQERFRIPVLDPAMIVYAAAWAGSLAGRRSPGPAAAGLT